jgi:hypothetical protein
MWLLCTRKCACRLGVARRCEDCGLNAVYLSLECSHGIGVAHAPWLRVNAFAIWQCSAHSKLEYSGILTGWNGGRQKHYRSATVAVAHALEVSAALGTMFTVPGRITDVPMSPERSVELKDSRTMS